MWSEIVQLLWVIIGALDIMVNIIQWIKDNKDWIQVVLQMLSLGVTLYIFWRTSMDNRRINEENIKRYELESKEQFETKFYDFLYSINHIYQIKVTIENNIHVEKFFNMGLTMEPTLAYSIENLLIEFAYIGNFEYTKDGGVEKKEIKEHIKIPLKYVHPIHSIYISLCELRDDLYVMDTKILRKVALDLLSEIEEEFSDLKKHLYL